MNFLLALMNTGGNNVAYDPSVKYYLGNNQLNC